MCPVLDHSDLRAAITWNQAYRPEWDTTPDLYAEHGLVPWGKSKRLGLLRVGKLKAYVGVQHIDPSLPGWAIVEAPETRFFVTLLASNRTVGLRTFYSMRDALDFLEVSLS